MQIDQSLPRVDRQSIIDCFIGLYNNNSTSADRKLANSRLFDMERNSIQLLSNLICIFQDGSNPQLSLQTLVYFCNVLKRNWTERRYNKAHSQFDALKRQIRTKILEYICMKDKRFMVTLFDMLKFIVKIDFPHNYAGFTHFILKMINEIQFDQMSVLIFKEIKEIFVQFGQKKGSISKKQFQQNLGQILKNLGEYSSKFKDAIVSFNQNRTLNSIVIKLSKYTDQIVMHILRIAPAEIMDSQFSCQITQCLIQKLQTLLTLHNNGSKEVRTILEKNIKSIIYDFGLMQLSKPFLLTWILKDLYNILFYVLQNHHLFIKNSAIRYSLIGLKRIIKQFSYYAEDSVFMASIKSKSVSQNHLQLRRMCNHFYSENITDPVVEQLLNFLIFNPFSRAIKEHIFFDLEEVNGIQKGKEKEMGLEGCAISLIEGLLERFTHFTHGLIANLVINSINCNWENIDQTSLGNLFSVIALLPATCKKNEIHHLQSIPILEILQFICNNRYYKLKFANIVSGWLDAFNNEQINGLTKVLLDFIQNEGAGQIEDEAVDVLMGCCQCLNKIINQRTQSIDLRQTIQLVLPVSLTVFQTIQNPEVLWPMVTLVSNIITKVQFDTQLIVSSIDSYKLALLIGNKSQTLVQALCDMFKGFLCVIPRNMPAKSVYQIVCHFLNNHLSQFSSVNHQKIFNLWYIAIREYSAQQQCDQLYVELFQNHFRSNLYRKTATLVYILEEYMLSCLIPDSISNFVSLVIDCYTEAETMEKQEREKLKIAALSFQITLITKYNLQQANSNRMLQLILSDLFNYDPQIVSPTVRNSLVSIINRYIIDHQQSFFAYLNSINLPLSNFLETYFKSMEFLTSHAAMKINSIALLLLLNNLDLQFILPQLRFILQLIIPQVEAYCGTLQNSTLTTFIGKIDNSPTLRFASNILSQRKQQIRKNDNYQVRNILNEFRQQIGFLISRSGISVNDIAGRLQNKTWGQRFYKLLQL